MLPVDAGTQDQQGNVRLNLRLYMQQEQQLSTAATAVASVVLLNRAH